MVSQSQTRELTKICYVILDIEVFALFNNITFFYTNKQYTLAFCKHPFRHLLQTPMDSSLRPTVEAQNEALELFIPTHYQQSLTIVTAIANTRFVRCFLVYGQRFTQPFFSF